MTFIDEIFADQLHRFLEKKLKEFDERDASIEEVSEFLAKYGYHPK